ncbi:GerMN domain-containing protein [Neobacillus sp. YIM B06451]|uniref:GerMN domain-containing protein n=1 Tax=Neobacillus sp. YIM B06451 TaxID=3070994 RepID=UPI00292CD7BD|nr:GerMN domain-containing protein [Neobacillus sp. YIM B06451]
MKRSNFDSQLKMLNNISLTGQESSDSYQRVISKVNKVKKRKNIGIIFGRPITGIATILVLIVAGWFLNDLVNYSNNQPGDQKPSLVEDDNSIVDEKTNACMESNVELSANSILVYFECDGFKEQQPPSKAVLREVNSEEKVESRIEYAVKQLIRGPSKEEIAEGFISIFNEETADLLHSIELQDSGHLIVDFVDFSKIIPNGNASAASFGMMETLNKTVSQFAEVETIEYRFDGSCAEFFGWIQQSCTTYEADDYRDLEENTKKLLLERSEVLFNQLMTKQWGELANNIHLERGLVYSPYSNVGDSDDLHFSKEEVRRFSEDQKQYSWSWDQSETEFKATPNDFVENLLKKRNNYIYEYDEITYNDSNVGTMINTIHDIYPNAIYVEYLDEPDRESLDWGYYQAIRFVYEEIDNEWYLIALVRGAHNP